MPILVGGHSQAALRRAARFGAGWYGFALTPETTAPLLQRLDTALAASGRSGDDFEIIVTPNVADDDAIRAFRDLGVHRLVLHLGSQRPDKVAARLAELERAIAAAA